MKNIKLWVVYCNERKGFAKKQNGRLLREVAVILLSVVLVGIGNSIWNYMVVQVN